MKKISSGTQCTPTHKFLLWLRQGVCLTMLIGSCQLNHTTPTRAGRGIWYKPGKHYDAVSSHLPGSFIFNLTRPYHYYREVKFILYRVCFIGEEVSIILEIITFLQLNHYFRDLPLRNHYLSGWYQWQFHLILGGDFNCGIISRNQWLLARDFKTESLMYQGDIHGKSLLTVVTSMVVSLSTWRGFQLWNHWVESMITGLRFQNWIISVSGEYPWGIITYQGGINGGFTWFSAGISIAKSFARFKNGWLAISKPNH